MIIRFYKGFFVFIFCFNVGCGIDSAAHAAEGTEDVKSVYFNGQSWSRIQRINPEWAETFKIFLIRGILEGMMAQNPELYYDVSSRIDYRTAVRALDKYYAGDQNAAVPVTYALTSMLNDTSAKKKKAGNVLVSLET